MRVAVGRAAVTVGPGPATRRVAITVPLPGVDWLAGVALVADIWGVGTCVAASVPVVAAVGLGVSSGVAVAGSAVEVGVSKIVGTAVASPIMMGSKISLGRPQPLTTISRTLMETTAGSMRR